jgi:hypothetical protein
LWRQENAAEEVVHIMVVRKQRQAESSPGQDKTPYNMPQATNFFHLGYAPYFPSFLNNAIK